MINVINAHYEMYICPTVIVGKTDDECTIYSRYRWGHLTVRIDPREDPPFGGAGGTWIFAEQIGDQYDGSLDYGTLVRLTKDLITWPVKTDD